MPSRSLRGCTLGAGEVQLIYWKAADAIHKDPTSYMNIATLVECVRRLPPGISVLIKGDHGIGKSMIVRMIARVLKNDMIAKGLLAPGSDYPVVDRRLSQMSEGDMIGLPSQDGKTTRFLPMDWFMECVESPCLLFLDEGNRGSQEVLQASFQIALDLELNGHHLNPLSRVMMAINADETKYQVNPMDPAFIDRWWICDLQPTFDEWMTWALDQTPEGGCVHKHITDFLTVSRLMLDPSYNEGPSEKDTSRRSWARFSQCYVENKLFDLDLTNEANKTFLTHFAEGFLGKPVAGAFLTYVCTIERHISALDILDNFENVTDRIEALSQGEVNGVNNKIVEWVCENVLTTDQCKRLGKWFECQPAEISCGLWQQIAMHPGKTTVNIKLMHKYIAPFILMGVNNTTKTV